MRGRTRLFARVVAWLEVPIYVAGTTVLIMLGRRIGVQGEDPVEGVVIFGGFGMFAVVGALLVAKRLDNVIGWIMSAAALMIGILPAGETYAAYVMTARGRPDALDVAGVWANSWYWSLLLPLIFIFLPMFFPMVACLPAAGSRSSRNPSVPSAR